MVISVTLPCKVTEDNDQYVTKIKLKGLGERKFSPGINFTLCQLMNLDSLKSGLMP